MTASRSALTSRWKTPAGRAVVPAIEDALRNGTTAAALREIVRALPQVEEVAPATDLRGIALPELIAAAHSDLAGARFDRARVSWAFGGSVLTGAVFDHAEGRNADFGGCELTRSSFRGANLPGAVFFGAKLTDADLAGIKLRSGQLKAADCRHANFEGADLRLVWAADADLRGANLRGANLVGASLGGARWDEHTRCDGAQFSWEGTPAEFATHALAQGATVRSEKPEWELALLDATRVALQGDNADGAVTSVVARLDALKAQVQTDPQCDWGSRLREGLTPEQRARVERAVRVAASNIGALLG